MKSQLCSVLFAMVVSVSACGGERRESTPTEHTPVSSTAPNEPMLDEPKLEKVGERPVETKPIVEIELPQTYVDALKLGKELVDKGEHARARELLALAAKLDKQQSDPHIELARSYIATNERANAIKSANKAVKLAPESSQAYNTLGRAELLRHDYENAIEAFRQATELNPDNVWAWNNLGFTFLTLKKYQEAADALVEATSRKGTTGYMWNNLGTAYEHLDLLDDAREAFEHGGKLGSVAASASRKRLEGVDTIVVVNDKPSAEPIEPSEQVDGEAKPAVEHGYDSAEPMPEPELEPVDDEPEVIEPKIEESGVDVKVETKVDAVIVDEPTLDVEGEPTVDEPKELPGVL